MDDRDIFLVEVARRGRNGDYAGASDVAALKSRADALEARPNITSLNAVPNVNAPSPANNQVLTYIDSASRWEPRTPQAGVLVRNGGTAIVPTASTLDFHAGPFQINNISDSYAVVEARYAGSGTANTLARSDHTHTTASKARASYTGGGYLSSGSRSLGSVNVTLAAGVTYLVEAWPEGQLRGADPGAGYYTISITIAGNTRTSVPGKKWVVQGVPNDPKYSHERTIVGTGTAITISASCTYSSGAGISVDDGELVVRLTPNR